MKRRLGIILFIVGMVLGGILVVVVGHMTRPLPEYAQDTVCRSVCMSCGECLAHRGIKLRTFRQSSRQSSGGMDIDFSGLPEGHPLRQEIGAEGE